MFGIMPNMKSSKTSKAKKIRDHLTVEETQQLLNGLGLWNGVPLGDAWVQQCAQIKELQAHVESHVRGGQGTVALVAQALSRPLRKRFVGVFETRTTVNPSLYLSFERGPSKIPTMAELRKQATAMGVDISHLGVQRKAIVEFLRCATPQIKADEVGKSPGAERILGALRGKTPLGEVIENLLPSK